MKEVTSKSRNFGGVGSGGWRKKGRQFCPFWPKKS